MNPTTSPADAEAISKIAETVALVDDLDAQRRIYADRVESLTGNIDVRTLSDADLSRLAGLVFSGRVTGEINTRTGHHIRSLTRTAANPRFDSVHPVLNETDVVQNPVECARAVIDFKQRFGTPDTAMTVSVGMRSFWVKDDDVDAVTARIIALFA
jgi:hypothetical protein